MFCVRGTEGRGANTTFAALFYFTDDASKTPPVSRVLLQGLGSGKGRKQHIVSGFVIKNRMYAKVLISSMRTLKPVPLA